MVCEILQPKEGRCEIISQPPRATVKITPLVAKIAFRYEMVL